MGNKQKTMKTIFGLDLGTTSIGWAVVRERENDKEHSSILRLGVRENPLAVDEKNNFEKGKTVTTNADRTRLRGVRRNLQRYKLRRVQLIDCLIANGWINEDTLKHKREDSAYAIYRMRARAVEEQIPLSDFAKILLMINKKRGYKSNRKDKSSKEEGTLVDGMEVAKILYEQQITPGEYLLQLLKEGKRNKPEFYRSDLQEEWERIWTIQQQYYPEVLTDALKSELIGKNGKQTSSILDRKAKISTAMNKGKDRREQALQWRTNALKHRLDIEEVAYVLCDINAAISGGSLRLAMISDRSKELYFKKQTIGQYLYSLVKENRHNSLKNIIFYRQDYIDEFERIWETQARYYRSLTLELRKEIERIIFYQRDLKSCKHLIALCELEQKEMVIKDKSGVEKKLLIGPKVAPKSSPIFQEYRIWQSLNDIILYKEGSRTRKSVAELSAALITEEDWNEASVRPLKLSEKELLYRELSIRERLDKKEVLSLLFGKKYDWDMNFNKIEGNTTNSILFQAYQEIISLTGNGDFDFTKLSADKVFQLVEEVFTRLNYKTDFLCFDSTLRGKALESQAFYRLWHLLYSYAGDTSSTGTVSLLNKIRELCGFEEEYARVLLKISFKDDYASISAKAISNLLPFMKEGYQYSEACEKVGYNHSIRSRTKEEVATRIYKDKLETLSRNSLRNPVVEKILNQMIHVINGLVATYGRPDEIRVELARELKKSNKEREEMTSSINKQTKDNERIRQLLETEFNLPRVTKNDIIRYRLYEELKENSYRTLYSNTYIPRERLFTNDFDVEHIIPKAKMFNDSFSNKTLELRTVNLEKSDMTAYDYVEQKIGKGLDEYILRVENLFKEGGVSKSKRNFLLMKEKDIPQDFLNRDLCNTQYIARKAVELLENVSPKVTTTIGAITNRLRKDWGLENLMQELNWDKYEALNLTTSFKDKHGKVYYRIKNWTKRNDHRHHAMDALTIAFTKPSIIQYLNNLNAKDDEGNYIKSFVDKELTREGGRLTFNSPIPRNEFRAQAKRHLENVLISTKAKNKVVTPNLNKTKSKGGIREKTQLTPRGSLHNESIYGQIRQRKVLKVKINAKLTYEVISKIAETKQRNILLARLEEFGGDPKKAFSTKNLEKKPLWLDNVNMLKFPEEIRLIDYEPVFTIRKQISPDLKIEKVIDDGVRKVLQERLQSCGNDATRAFSNLTENPIWLNKEKEIAIKSVKIRGITTGTPIRCKRDINGKLIIDSLGKNLPNDFVSTANNHHVAIHKDINGNFQEHIVSFYEATSRAIMGYPIIDKTYHAELGWQYCFSMKQNEYFVFPNPQTDFYPDEIDLLDEANYHLVSPNLFRVQKLASKDYVFRHHLETTIEDVNELKDITWKRITALKNLAGVVKVRIDHIGRIVAIGEY